jgi:hypothetical protein
MTGGQIRIKPRLGRFSNSNPEIGTGIGEIDNVGKRSVNLGM